MKFTSMVSYQQATLSKWIIIDDGDNRHNS